MKGIKGQYLFLAHVIVFGKSFNCNSKQFDFSNTERYNMAGIESSERITGDPAKLINDGQDNEEDVSCSTC